MDTEKNGESEVITYKEKPLPTWVALAISMVLATVLVGVFLYIEKAKEPARQLVLEKNAVVEYMAKVQTNVRTFAAERDINVGDPLTVEALKEAGYLPPLPKLTQFQVKYHYAAKVPELGEPYVTVDNKELMAAILDARKAAEQAEKMKP